MGLVSRSLATSVTVHQGHMPEIELTSDLEARGIWAMFDRVDEVASSRPPVEPSWPPPWTTPQAAGPIG